MFYATGPRQHWAATTSGTLLPLGFLVNVGVAWLLVFTTYSALVWTFQSFNAKLSIATLLGLVSYAALVFAFEVGDNAEHYEMFPRLRELFVETCVFDYIEKVVWLTLFIACLWIPNRLAQFYCTRERAGNHAMNRSGR